MGRRDLNRKHRRFTRATAPVSRIDAMWADVLCAYLDCEPKAVWVLSDFLQEAGIEPLAAGSRERRVRWVMSILAPPLAHRVACDQAEHVLDLREVEPGHAWRELVATKRRWMDGEVDDLVLAQVRLPRQPIYPPWTWDVNRMIEAVRATSPSPSTVQAVPVFAIRAAPSETAEIRWQTTHLQRVLRRGGRTDNR